MTIALIDYGAGNLHSVHNALKAAGAADIAVTADPETVLRADRIVLPGVGAFGACMAGLEAIPGMIEAMESRVFGGGHPFLGVCVGMQLMAEYGEEHGTHRGMGWVAGSIEAIPPAPGAPVPHMGWNDVIPTWRSSLVQRGEAYFLHSYSFKNNQLPSCVRAFTRHGDRKLVAAIQTGTALGVQFHPEKSQRYGIALMERFLSWRP